MQKDKTTPLSGAYAWYVPAPLFAVYAMNIADRQIVAILAEDTKRDLGLGDSEIRGHRGDPVHLSGLADPETNGEK